MRSRTIRAGGTGVCQRASAPEIRIQPADSRPGRQGGFRGKGREKLAEVERLFLEELITTADAQEGLSAFLEKRKAEWKNR